MKTDAERREAVAERYYASRAAWNDFGRETVRCAAQPLKRALSALHLYARLRVNGRTSLYRVRVTSHFGADEVYVQRPVKSGGGWGTGRYRLKMNDLILK